MLETLQGLSEVIQYQQKQQRMTRLTSQTEDLLATEQQMKKLTGFNIAMTNLIIMLCNISMIIVASILYTQSAISFVGFVLSITALMSSYGPVIALSNLASTLQNTFAAAHRILDILEEEPVVQPIHNQPTTEFGPVDVQQVSFKYEQTPVLTNVSLQVKPESILGIRGKSGSGKSTLLKLLMRFWETNQGDITINQRSLKAINTTDLRDMQAYMTQETHLFNDTIANNIKIAKLDASMEDIIEASKKASLHEFVEGLPLGYETKTGELGNALSGGERQRIGLARAFLHDSDLMLLDEPTSNLDSLNEAIILKSLAEKRENKTIVLVSHRPSTMAITDTMIQLKEGQIQS
ncbi:MAG TPA: ABC transporter ATP-binding protein [Erysipelothrix sp.]|nr:ABC transporter ATP-binding protein [Erysipelothrix sp.]